MGFVNEIMGRCGDAAFVLNDPFQPAALLRAVEGYAVVVAIGLHPPVMIGPPHHVHARRLRLIELSHHAGAPTSRGIAAALTEAGVRVHRHADRVELAGSSRQRGSHGIAAGADPRGESNTETRSDQTAPRKVCPRHGFSQGVGVEAVPGWSPSLRDASDAR